MDECVEAFLEALKRMVAEGVDVHSMNIVALKHEVVKRLPRRLSCPGYEALRQALRLLRMGRATEGGGAWIPVTIRMPRGGFVSPDGASYPSYTLAEIIYVYLYEKDPKTAHVKMYELLEPVVLGDAKLTWKRMWFVPVNSRPVWRRLMRELTELLPRLDEERRRTVCGALAFGMDLLARFDVVKTMIGVPSVDDEQTITVEIPSRLLDLCPELRSWMSGGSA